MDCDRCGFWECNGKCEEDRIDKKCEHCENLISIDIESMKTTFSINPIVEVMCIKCKKGSQFENPYFKDDNSFLKDFPSLKRRDIMLGQFFFPQNDLATYCLDKERVKKSWKKYSQLLCILKGDVDVDKFLDVMEKFEKELGIEQDETE